MPKYLVVKKKDMEQASNIYPFIYNNYYFTRHPDHRHSIIVPYVIMTDGSDVIMFETPELKLNIGFECPIEKSSFFFHKTPDNLQKLIQEEILMKFDEMFSETNFPLTEMVIHPTYKCAFSLDKQKIYLIYFLVLPSNKTIKFKPLKNLRLNIFPYADSVKIGLTENQSDLITKVVSFLIISEQIGLPGKEQVNG